MSVRMPTRCGVALLCTLFAAIAISPAAGQTARAASEPARTAPAPLVQPEQSQPRRAALDRLVTLDLRGVRLGEALRGIADSGQVSLIYSGEVVPLERRVTVTVRRVTVRQALAVALAGTDVEPRAVGEQIVLAKRAPGRERSEVTADTLPGTIYGRVTDAETGQALARAVVEIYGSSVTISAHTDGNGRYRLLGVPPGEHVVHARFLGYKATMRTVVVSSGTTIQQDLALVPTASRLDAVVTTATGPRRKLELGSDITILDADSIMRAQPVASVTELLEGRVPGMVVQRSSGAPGDPARIRLRGAGSPSLSNDPIIIVDGIRVYSTQSGARGTNLANALEAARPDGNATTYAAPSPLDYIDPHSIETIEVVKGPSAATMYGQDAANGVILITTKAGRAGPARWSVTAERGTTEMVGDYPELMMRWGHRVTDDGRVFCPITDFGCVADSTVRFQMLNDPELTVLDRGGVTGTSVGVSGGSQALTYNFTGSFRDELGLVRLPAYQAERYLLAEGRSVPDWMERPQHLKRWGATSRVVARLGANADVSVSAELSRVDQQRSELERQIGRLMGTYLDRSSGQYYRSGGAGNVSETDDVLSAFHERARATATTFRNGGTLNWRALPWLTTAAEAGVNLVQRSDEILLPSGTRLGSDAEGRLRSAQGTSLTSTVNMRANATVPISMGFGLQVATGVNYRGESVNDLRADARGIAPGTETPLQTAQMEFRNGRVEQATFGWYIEPQLSHQRFWISTGLRLDGGNTFGTRVKLPAFPKLSLSYLISDESFFPWKEHVPMLRLRMAYGHAGRQPGPVDRLRLYGATNPVWIDGQLADAVQLAALGNTRLQPERTQETEGGFDTDLFDSRVTLSFTGYRKTTRDALMQAPVPPSVYGSGITRLINIGVIRNEGVEATIGAEVVRSSPLSWHVQLALSQNRNDVLELGPGVQPFYSQRNSCPSSIACGGTRVAAGYPLFGRWMRPVLGYADANGDGLLAREELIYGDTAVFVGGTLPNYQANLHTSVRLLRGAVAVTAGFLYEDGMTQQNDVGRELASFTAGRNDPNTSLAEQARMWDQTGFSWVQTVNVLRFNSLGVTYNLPTTAARRAGARAMSVAVQGSNLALRTNYHGIDPSVNALSSGNAVIDRGVLPRPRTVQVRVNATY